MNEKKIAARDALLADVRKRALKSMNDEIAADKDHVKNHDVSKGEFIREVDPAIADKFLK